jgi:thioesterase domain-containing protein
VTNIGMAGLPAGITFEDLLQQAALAEAASLQSPLEIDPLNDDGTSARLPLFLFGPSRDTGTGFRRLAQTFSETLAISHVRPANGVYDPRGPYFIEETAAEAAAVLLKATGGKSFLLGGFCTGGMIAWETGRLLQQLGCQGLVLFDTPIPGHLGSIANPLHIRSTLRTLSAFLRAPASDRYGESYRTLLHRKFLWHTVRVLRPWLQPYWFRAKVSKRTCAAQRNEAVNFYSPRRIHLPVLHVLAANVDSVYLRQARLDWQHRTSGKVQQTTVDCGHEEIFFRPHQPLLQQRISAWIRALQH